MIIKTYTIFEVAKILKTTRSSIKQYIERQLISPSVQEAKGRGTKNLFSTEDIYKIQLIKMIHRSGLSQRQAAGICGDIDFSNLKKKKLLCLHIIPSTKGWHFNMRRTNSLNMPNDSDFGNPKVYLRINVSRIIESIDLLLKE